MAVWRFLSTIFVTLTAIWWAASTTEQKWAQQDSRNVTVTGQDPVYLVDERQLDEAVSCCASTPQAKETVLLVSGTGVTPRTSWEYTLLPPLLHEGVQPCYVTIPHRLLDDIQVSAEYISYAIKKLADEGNASQISIISWSAGALTTQWTLTFYPEARSKVKRHIALGPDYRGSWTMIPLVYLNMFTEALVQQMPWSKFMKTMARFDGYRALVPTTSIGSSTDLIVQPGFYGAGWPFLRDTWRLSGPQARNIDIFKLCAVKSLRQGAFPHIVSHDSLLWEAASHEIIFAALNNEETYLGSADGLTSDHCRGGPANHLPPGSENKHAAIMPELSYYAANYASKRPLRGWPEVPLRKYASVERLEELKARDETHG